MSIPIAFLREIMEIHPIKGIDLGLCIGLSSLNVSVSFVFCVSGLNFKKINTCVT